MVMVEKEEKTAAKNQKPNFERARTRKQKAHGFFCANESISPKEEKCRKHTPIIIKIN